MNHQQSDEIVYGHYFFLIFIPNINLFGRNMNQIIKSTKKKATQNILSDVYST